MKSGLGAVYEFLRANPYQPGLSYFHVQPVFHDADTGHIFARTSWDEGCHVDRVLWNIPHPSLLTAAASH